MRTTRALWVGCLLAVPLLALAPPVPGQADPACTSDGADVVCVWEGELTVAPAVEPGPGDQCLRTLTSPVRSATVLEQPVRVPFPARVAARLTTSDGLNDLLLFLDGPGGTINRSFINEPAQVFHRVAQPADLVVRAELDTSGWRQDMLPPVPLETSLPERYRLEVRMTPFLPQASAVERREEVNLGGQLPANQYRIICGAYVGIWDFPIDAPALVEVDIQRPSLNYSVVAPDDEVRVLVVDALGARVADFRTSPTLSRFGALAAEGFGWGDWYLLYMLDDRVGANEPHVVSVQARAAPLATGEALVPTPVVPVEPLVADPSDDAAERAMDVLGAWFSDDGVDALAFHILLSEVAPAGLAPDEGSRRYEATWTYAGARVMLRYQATTDQTTFFYAVLDGEEGQRLSAIPGRVTPGNPGVLSFLVPKAFVGSPAPGKALEGVAVSTHRVRAALPSPVLGAAGADPDARPADQTVDDAAYIVGGSAPGSEGEAALRPAALSATGPWGPLSSVNSLLGVASALALGAIGAAALLARRKA